MAAVHHDHRLCREKYPSTRNSRPEPPSTYCRILSILLFVGERGLVFRLGRILDVEPGDRRAQNLDLHPRSDLDASVPPFDGIDELAHEPRLRHDAVALLELRLYLLLVLRLRAIREEHEEDD